MAKFIMITHATTLEGCDDAYNQWFDSQHLQEILDIPGVTGARRFESTPIALGQPGGRYITIFEVEADDPGSIMAEMGARAADGRVTSSPLIDRSQSVLWFYAEREIAG